MKMIFVKFFILFLVSFLCIPTFANAEYSETFDTDTGGFHYGYGPGYTDGPVSWSATGGNPNGHISGKADDLYAIWIYSSDTASGFGDLTGLTLAIDTKIEGTVSGAAKLYIGREGKYYISSGSWDVASDSDWTTHSIVLDSSNLIPWGGADNLPYILENPDDIGIFFNGLTASGTGNILVDNFGAPPPAIPTLNEWGMILFTILAGLIAGRQLQRKDKKTFISG